MLCIGLATYTLTLFDFGAQATQLALALSAGCVLPGIYGASLRKHGLRCVGISALLTSALYFASNPFYHLLVIIFG